MGASISVSTLDLNGAAQTFTVADSSGAADDVTIAAATTVQNGSLIKKGAGALRLDGVQSYNALTADAGTTNVNGPLGTAPGMAVVDVGPVTPATLKLGSVSQTLSSLTIGAGSTVIFSSGPASGSLTGDGGKAPGFGGGGSAVVPEPGTLGLLLVGALGVLNRRRRQV